MSPQDRTVEEILERIASGSHGVVTRREALRAGVTATQVRHRVRKGVLIQAYPGVYRLGHRAPSVEAFYLAAVRSCGEGAALCGRAAAYLLGLNKGPAPPPEVTTTTERRIDGVLTSRARRLDPRDVMIHRAIPVTTVPRTLVDLAAVLTDDELARACHEAGVWYRTTPRDVEGVLARRPTTPGARKLRRIMRGEMRVSLSELERRFLALLRQEGLPLPVTNRPAGGRRVDCRWAQQRLTVELDSYRYHASRHAWEQDRRRERQARARGDDFARYTWEDVFQTAQATIRELRGLLRGKRPA